MLRGVFSLWCALAFLGLASDAALAADKVGSSSALSDPAFQKSEMVDAKGRKITVINFDDAVIEGAARAPDGFVLQSRQAGSFRNIIQLRREFRLQLQSDAALSTVVVPPAP